MGDFVAYASKWRIALLILLSAGFVSIGLWMAAIIGPMPTSHRYSPAFMFVIGWLSIIFFGFCGVVAIKRFFDTGEQLRIGSSGVRVRTWSDQTIPWTEITNVTIWSYKRQRTIILHLRDPSLYPGRGAVALMTKANRALTGGDIGISLIGSDRSFDEAMAAIEQYRR